MQNSQKCGGGISMAAFVLQLSIQYFCDQWSPYFYCALRTKFLTAEAADAGGAVDARNTVLHGDGVRRADGFALFASNAQRIFHCGHRAHGFLNDFTH